MCIWTRGCPYLRGVHILSWPRVWKPRSAFYDVGPPCITRHRADIGPIPPCSCPDIGPTSEKQILSIGLSEIGTTSGHPVGCRIHGSQRCIVMRHHILHNLIVHIIYIHVECFSGLLTLMLAPLFQAVLDDFSYDAVYNCACLADYLFSPMKF